MYIVYFKKGDEPFPARADADFHRNSAQEFKRLFLDFPLLVKDRDGSISS
ncbi:hypothetical protein ACR79R_15035 [Sphingobacterium spiritivorum]